MICDGQIYVTYLNFFNDPDPRIRDSVSVSVPRPLLGPHTSKHIRFVIAPNPKSLQTPVEFLLHYAYVTWSQEAGNFGFVSIRNQSNGIVLLGISKSGVIHSLQY